MAVEDLDVRVSGEGPTGISRVAVTLSPLTGQPLPAPRTLEERVADLEAQVAALTTRLEQAEGVTRH